jgi:hypothetical protein
MQRKELSVLDFLVCDENLPLLTPTVSTLGRQEKNSILEQVAIVERFTVHLLDNSLSSELQEQACRESLELASSLETLGLTFAAQLAQGISLLFQGKMPFEEAVILQLAEFVITLCEIVERDAKKNNGTERAPQLSSEKISFSSKNESGQVPVRTLPYWEKGHETIITQKEM